MVCRGMDDMGRCWARRGNGRCMVVGVVGGLILSVGTWVLHWRACRMRVSDKWAENGGHGQQICDKDCGGSLEVAWGLGW